MIWVWSLQLFLYLWLVLNSVKESTAAQHCKWCRRHWNYERWNYEILFQLSSENFFISCLSSVLFIRDCVKNGWNNWRRVKRPLLAWVPSLDRFFDNLTEITCVKEQVAEFFFTEAVNTVVWWGTVGLMCTVTIQLEKKSVTWLQETGNSISISMRQLYQNHYFVTWKRIFE